MRSGTRRIKGIDICRSAAIFLAMFSHAMAEFGLKSLYDSPFMTFVGVVTQMAPVVFICLFGAMLELAYARRFRSGDAAGATGRLLNRALQCYVLYGVSVLAHVLAGDFTLGFALRCLLMIGGTPFTDILKFYALALLLAPLLITLRLRFGLLPLGIAAVAIHLLYPLHQAIPPPPPLAGADYIGMGTRFLIGVGETMVGGPSLVHGLSLVMLGMIVGNATGLVGGEDPAGRRKGLGMFLALFLVGAIPALLMWDFSRSALLFRELAYLVLRNENHPLYYAFGLAFTAASSVLCILVFDILRQGWADSIRFLGTVSLFTFCFGNILLILQPFEATGPASSALLTAVFTALIVAQSYLYYRLSREPAAGRDAAQQPRVSPGALVRAVTEHATAIFARLLSPFVATYLRGLGWRQPAQG